MNKTGKKASELLDALPRRFSSDEIRIAVDESDKLAIVEQVKAQLLADGISFQGTDGVRAQLEQGWWLLRASNTGASLVVRYEAKSESCFGSVERSLKSYLKIVGIEGF